MERWKKDRNGGDSEREVSQHAGGRSLRREEVDPCDRSDPGRTISVDITLRTIPLFYYTLPCTEDTTEDTTE